MLHAWVALGPGGGGGVQGFRLKFSDFGQPVQGSALSRLASMNYVLSKHQPTILIVNIQFLEPVSKVSPLVL